MSGFYSYGLDMGDTPEFRPTPRTLGALSIPGSRAWDIEVNASTGEMFVRPFARPFESTRPEEGKCPSSDSCDYDSDEEEVAPAKIDAKVYVENMDESSRSVLEDASKCPICMDSWTSSGEHRTSVLPCGHVFGRSCIANWIYNSPISGCPQCHRIVGSSDIRPVYPPVIFAAKKAESREAEAATRENIPRTHDTIPEILYEEFINAYAESRQLAIARTHAHNEFIRLMDTNPPEGDNLVAYSTELCERRREYREAENRFAASRHKCYEIITRLTALVDAN